MAKAGISAAVWTGLSKTLLAIVLSPLVGFCWRWCWSRSCPGLGALDAVCGRPRLRILQFVSASLYSLGHGGNDAQKTMGIIAVLLYSQGHLGADFAIPFWVVMSCQAAMGLGTLMGGWRIVRTMGLRITKLTPMQGFCARNRRGGDPVHGDLSRGSRLHDAHHYRRHRRVGAARRVSAVRWNVASSIVYAWVITIPASGSWRR